MALPQWTLDLKTYAYADIQTTEEENKTWESLLFYVYIDFIRIVWISFICGKRIIWDSMQNLVDLIVWICFMAHFMYWNSSNLVTLFHVFISSGRVLVIGTNTSRFTCEMADFEWQIRHESFIYSNYPCHVSNSAFWDVWTNNVTRFDPSTGRLYKKIMSFLPNNGTKVDEAPCT